LGLTISKQLANLQGGSIRVESNINEGSTFYLKLSYKIGKGKIKEKPSKVAAIKEQKSFSNIKILLAEDNEINQLFVKTILKSKFKIEIAGNGKVVLDLLKYENFDLILMDLHMPEMDGYETTQQIRKNPDIKKRNTPIIALTAAAIKGEKDKCLEYGMNDYLSKPFEPEDLLNLIMEHLEPAEMGIEQNDDNFKIRKKRSFKNFDLSYIESIGDGDFKFQNELIQIFKDQIPILIKQMTESLENKNYSELGAIAHKAKSSVAMFGISELTQDMETLENDAKNKNNIDNFSGLIQNFIDISNKVLEEMKDLKI